MTLRDELHGYRAGRTSKEQYIENMHGLHQSLFDYAEFIGGTDVSEIQITDHQVTITFRSSKIKVICDRSDRRAAPMEILNFNSYEKSYADIFFGLIQKGDTVFDIGANTGWYTMHLAKYFPESAIFAFEPVRGTFTQLKNNCALNKLGNVKLFNFGFSNEKKKMTFYYEPEYSGRASGARLVDSPGVQKLSCNVKRLDDFVKTAKTSVDLIKCDCEGAELLVFQGGLQTLKKYKPSILTEMVRKWSAKFNYHPNQIIEMLKELGYGCYSVKAAKLIPFKAMNEDTKDTNFFFLHRSRQVRGFK